MEDVEVYMRTPGPVDTLLLTVSIESATKIATMASLLAAYTNFGCIVVDPP